MTVVVSGETVQKALIYRAETDAQYGMLRALVEDYEYRIKMAEARATRENKDKGTQDYIKALAKSDPEYIKLIDELYNTNMEYQTMSAKRQTGLVLIDVWRSLNANARQGNIT